jgi:hypothetical protein
MSFNDDIKKLARKLAVTEAKAVATFCINISGRVDNMSPVDTGLFRANWQASLDQPYTGATKTANRAGSIDHVIPFAKAANGHVFYLTNKVPYAQALEYGHSQQAPSGMVRVSARMALEELENAVRSVQ